MPETNDDATKFAHSQDARDFLNTITQEAFADADYLDSLFAKPQIANDLSQPSRSAIPKTTNRTRQRPRPKPSRSRNSAVFAFLILGLTIALFRLLYVNGNCVDNEVAKRMPNAAEITKIENVSPAPKQRAPEKEEKVGNISGLSRQKNATHVIGVELFPNDYLKNVVAPPNPTPPDSSSVERQKSEAYRNLVARAIRRLREESKKKKRTLNLPGLPEIGNTIPKQTVRPIPTTATKTEANVDLTPKPDAVVANSIDPPKKETTNIANNSNEQTSSKVEQSTPIVTTEYVIKPVKISDAKIGDRTVGANPLGSEGLDENVFYEIPHYVYQLRFNDEDGSEWRVNLLRPYNWLAVSPIRIRDGFDGRPLNDDDLLFDECFPILPFPQSYYLDVRLESEEIGFQGWANVAAVDQTITIKPGKGNLVTGTFKHMATEVYDLYIEGQEKPIGCTKTHPFWSVDRQEFVPVDELYQNERVQCLDGSVRRAIDLQRRPKPEPVYNLEIFNEHVYRVTTDGILVHNHCPKRLQKADKFIRYVSQEELTNMGLPNFGNKIKGKQFFGPHGLVAKKNDAFKNISELNGEVFPSHLKADKSKYSFKITIYVDNKTRDELAKWGVKPCSGHSGTLALPRDYLDRFNNHIIGISVEKL